MMGNLMKQYYWAGLLALGVTLHTTAQSFSEEQLPAGAKVVRLEAQPATITLRNPCEYRQLLVTARLASGDKLDVTRLVRVETDTGPAVVSPREIVRPQKD